LSEASVETQNMLSFTFTLQHVFMAWCLGRGNCNVNFTFISLQLGLHGDVSICWEIRGFCSCVAEEASLLDCSAVLLGKQFLTFQTKGSAFICRVKQSKILLYCQGKVGFTYFYCRGTHVVSRLSTYPKIPQKNQLLHPWYYQSFL